MTNFGKWIRATWPETMKASRLSERTNDLANLAAQQHEALDRTNCLRFAANPNGAVCRYDGPGGLPRKEWCRICIAKHAVEEFMEKYES